MSGDIQFQFSTQGVDPRYAGGGGGLPIGKHLVVLVGGSWEAPKSNASTGNQNQMLVLEMSCVDGPAKGQTQLDRLNLQNSNQQASQIAYRQMAAYCTVCGQPGGIQARLSEIFNKPFWVEIGPQTGEEAQKKGWTEIKGIYDQAGNAPGAAPAGNGGTQAQPQGQPQGGFPQGSHAAGFAGGGGQPQGGFGGQPNGMPNGMPNGGGGFPQGGGQPQGGGFGAAAPAGAFGGQGGGTAGPMPPAGPQGGGQGGGGFGGGQQGGFGGGGGGQPGWAQNR